MVEVGAVVVYWSGLQLRHTCPSWRLLDATAQQQDVEGAHHRPYGRYDQPD